MSVTHFPLGLELELAIVGDCFFGPLSLSQAKQKNSSKTILHPSLMLNCLSHCKLFFTTALGATILWPCLLPITKPRPGTLTCEHRFPARKGWGKYGPEARSISPRDFVQPVAGPSAQAQGQARLWCMQQVLLPLGAQQDWGGTVAGFCIPAAPAVVAPSGCHFQYHCCH